MGRSDAGHPLISVEEALSIIRRETPGPHAEVVPLEAALGCILLDDVRAGEDIPSFPRAMMDGYAVRATDTAGAPAELKVLEEVPAGTCPTREVGPGCCVAILTGAPMPSGADAVVMVEDTELRGDRVRIGRAVPPGVHFVPRGAEVRRGDVVAGAGRPIRAQEVGVLAMVGAAEVRVARRPRAAVVTTGDELVSISEHPAPGHVRDCNGWSVTAQLRQAGVTVDYLGISRDEEGVLREFIRRGLTYDFLFLTGGVSMGTYDLVKPALLREGTEFFIEKVAVKPGKPMVFGRCGDTVVFGLPGNPCSTFVILEVFGRAALAKWTGNPLLELRRVRARLEGDAGKGGPRRQFLPSSWNPGPCGATVRRVSWKGSADLAGFARGDCLLAVPPGEPPSEGSEVEVLLFSGTRV